MIYIKVGITTYAIDGPLTGIGNYVYNLVNELSSISDYEFTLIHFQKNENKLYEVMDELLIPNYPMIPNALKSSFYLSSIKNFDMVHETGNIGLIFPTNFKKVVTIHSLYSILYPKAVPLKWRLKMQMAKHFYPYHKLDKIITISQSLKEEIISTLNVSDENVEVIYHGIDEKLFNVITDKEHLFTKLQKKYGINSNFILTVTTLQPTKNISVLVKAYDLLKKKYNLSHKLVIVGGNGWKFSETYKLIERLNLSNEIIFTGHIPYHEISLLYNAADLFVFPSLYEGFGFPPLEAMACGCPVITSNVSSLPEVIGDAGIMVSPYDVEGLSDKMYEVLVNDNLKNKLISKGLKRARKFDWNKTAKDTLAVYKEIYES